MWKSCITLILMSTVYQASAELTVIADLGGESTAPLFESIAPQPESGRPVPSPVQPLAQAVFPVSSTRLHPGVVTTRALSLPGMSPLFLIGDDPLSQSWLIEHKTKLQSLNANGLVVNVASAQRLTALQQLIELPLFPISGDDLAQRLQLDTYPVVITATGIWQ